MTTSLSTDRTSSTATYHGPPRVDRRIVALDGMRGVAILLVIAHNSGAIESPVAGALLKLWAMLANAGWIGVQIFFVLSGYLITGILLRSKGETGWLRSFYARRVLRIFPLYYAVLVLIYVVAPHVAFLAPLAIHSGSSLWYWTYQANWIATSNGTTRGLPHVWSLAVEEQFYALWPFVLLLTTERGLRILAVAMVVGAIGLRFVLHAALSPDAAAAATYEFTVTRWDAMAVGALFALRFLRPDSTPPAPRWRAAWIVVCLLLLAGVIVTQHGLAAHGRVADVITMPVTAILSGFLIFECALEAERRGPPLRSTEPLRRVLSARPLVAIGKYSYAIYLFQSPISQLLRPHMAGQLDVGAAHRLLSVLVFVAAVFVASFVLARISWAILERPMLSLKRYFPTPLHRTT